MQVREILARKGTDVVDVPPDATVADAVHVLVEHDIGSVLVTDAGRVLGILTERDVLRLADGGPDALSHTRVTEAMTPEDDLLVGSPDHDTHYCMNVMTENRVRHLPVMEDGELRGIVSIGDVVNACRRDAEHENRYLKDYIRGEIR